MNPLANLLACKFTSLQRGAPHPIENCYILAPCSELTVKNLDDFWARRVFAEFRCNHLLRHGFVRLHYSGNRKYRLEASASQPRGEETRELMRASYYIQIPKRYERNHRASIRTCNIIFRWSKLKIRKRNVHHLYFLGFPRFR